MGHYSDFLFAAPSFTEGAARLFDFGGTLQEYNTSRTPEEADALAAYADWAAVGNLIRRSTRQTAKKLKRRPSQQP
jgi:hypothetical protein